MENMLMIFFSAIFVNNFVLAKFLGICPFLGVSKKLNSAVGMSLAVTFVMVMSTLITYPVYMYLLKPFGLEYLNKIAFILIIAMFVQLVEIVVKRFLPPLYHALGVYLPLITTNCAVLGVTVLNIDSQYTLLESLVNSFGAGIGFLLALVLFSGIREKLENCNIPKSFRGMPSTLIAASILAVSFMGFGGIIENIFG
ncbi:MULTISPECIES: electron transport complex protein RnfA [Clostridiaceae]|uniref:Ion-translocating oxidoreductase complex subunit A n=1 Tax=Clostridium facile TaxID=2763035 RepID=A0ABR7INW0_9CLOT|nr:MULTISPECIES: RnfABCDGE type electron transport complex subunit A [Clostridiaceae]MBC5786819.1 RnfABCDGE type electron transport complex subunit A [Clostridium facile]